MTEHFILAYGICVSALYASLVTAFHKCLLSPIIFRCLRGKKTTCLAMTPRVTHSMAQVSAYMRWSVGIVVNLQRGGKKQRRRSESSLPFGNLHQAQELSQT